MAKVSINQELSLSISLLTTALEFEKRLKNSRRRNLTFLQYKFYKKAWNFNSDCH